MTNPCNADFGGFNAVIVSRLSIERCQNYLAHLHALMHLSRPGSIGQDPLVMESAIRIMQTIESELAHSADALGMLDQPL